MLKKVISLSLGMILANVLYAQPVVSKGNFAKKLKKAAGEQGKFYRGKEEFPKDYFLVHQNLPFLAGLSLHHPKSSTLGLSKEQIKEIKKIKKNTVPAVLKKSKEIKKLELELAQNIAIDSNSAKSQEDIVNKISKLRTELTKAHLVCINEVRSILTKEQYKKLLNYATKMGAKNKSNKFKIDELSFLPHPGKLIKMGKLNVSKEQKQKIKKEIKAVYPAVFQEQMRKAFDLEKKLQRAVAKGKTKEELKELLDKIAQLKRAAMDGRIDALNHFKKVVSDEQWEKINKLTYK